MKKRQYVCYTLRLMIFFLTFTQAKFALVIYELKFLNHLAFTAEFVVKDVAKVNQYNKGKYYICSYEARILRSFFGK